MAERRPDEPTRHGPRARGDPVGVRAGDATARAELRELAVDLIAPNPDQPRKRFDEEALQALADSVKERGVLQPVLVRPRPGRELRARRRRAPLARRAARGPRDDARARPAARRRAVARGRADREHGPRGPQPDRGRARRRRAWSRSWGSRARRSAAASAAAASRSRTSCACSTCPTRRSRWSRTARSPRATAARCCWPTTTPTGAASPARRSQGGWSVRVVEQRAREANAPARTAKRGRAAVHPDQEAAAAEHLRSPRRRPRHRGPRAPSRHRLQGRAGLRGRRRGPRPGPPPAPPSGRLNLATIRAP